MRRLGIVLAVTLAMTAPARAHEPEPAHGSYVGKDVVVGELDIHDGRVRVGEILLYVHEWGSFDVQRPDGVYERGAGPWFEVRIYAGDRPARTVRGPIDTDAVRIDPGRGARLHLPLGQNRLDVTVTNAEPGPGVDGWKRYSAQGTDHQHEYSFDGLWAGAGLATARGTLGTLTVRERDPGHGIPLTLAYAALVETCTDADC